MAPDLQQRRPLAEVAGRAFLAFAGAGSAVAATQPGGGPIDGAGLETLALASGLANVGRARFVAADGGGATGPGVGQGNIADGVIRTPAIARPRECGELVASHRRHAGATSRAGTSAWRRASSRSNQGAADPSTGRRP
jgi:hypothetical protein